MVDQAKLQELRNQIDSIDSGILQLIEQRAALAPLVIAAKGPGAIWRPAREAQILRTCLNSLPNSAFPKSSLLGIWTNLMTGMTSIEVDFSFGLVDSRQSENYKAYSETLRNHFGNQPQFVSFDNLHSALASKNHQITAVPAITTHAATSPSQRTAAWWELLLQPQYQKYKIGFKLPFIPCREELQKLYLIGEIECESSGDDTSLVAIPIAQLGHFSYDKLHEIDRSQEWVLCKFKQFIAMDDAKIAASQAIVIGTYPNRLMANL